MADKIIFTSMDYGQVSDLQKFYQKNSQKFVEVPNGVDGQKFRLTPPDPTILRKYNITTDEKIVLFVGGLDKAHYFKGIEYLIEAMSRLRSAQYSWRLIIVGEGELKKEYQSLAEQLRIESKTIFTDYVSNEDLPKFYNLANVVVLPSVDKSEAFGLALVEAMACAKPVIASNLPGVRSVAENEVNGLTVTPRDSNDLATKINYLLENDEVAVKYGQKGRQKVDEKYDWNKVGQLLEELYKNL